MKSLSYQLRQRKNQSLISEAIQSQKKTTGPVQKTTTRLTQVKPPRLATRQTPQSAKMKKARLKKCYQTPNLL